MLTVIAANNAPNAVADMFLPVPAGGPVNLNVLANDSDVDGDTLAITLVAQGGYGSVATNGTMITYTPGGACMSGDSFTYSISDGYGGSATATVTVYSGQMGLWRAQKFGVNANDPAIAGDFADPDHDGLR